MGKFFDAAVADLEAALKLDPNSIVAYRQMIDMVGGPGSDAASARKFLDKALKAQPNSFILREAYMQNLLPRWGGSYDAMAKFAAESAPYAAKNPRINALRGFVDWDKGRVFERMGKIGDAIESYQRALNTGNYWQFHYDRGQYLFRADKNEDALEEFNAVLAQYPQNADALYERSGVAYELGRTTPGDASATYFSLAFHDIELAVALDPTDEDYQERLAFTRKNIPEYAPPSR
jgi:tetratricopeptide (TPR) repeat protein